MVGHPMIPPDPTPREEIERDEQERKRLARPLRPCAAGGCPALVRGDRYCSKHRRTVGPNAKRADTHYMSARWARLRKLILARDPWCKLCGVTSSNEVDHIVPRAKGGEDTMENLWGLCKSCHSRKTARESSGWK